MTIITLSTFDLILAASLLLLMGLVSFLLKVGLLKSIYFSALRMTLQLLLVGVVLKIVFADSRPILIFAMALVMLIAAAREVSRRQERRFSGWWGFGLGSVSMFLSSFSVTLLALLAIIRNDPWYMPRYAIPLLGMMLGNTMNGISLGLDRLTSTAWQQRAVIENRLMLGQNWSSAIADIRRVSIRSGMIPIINAMAAAGLVSLPGMMTGQILAGNPPFEAVKYQILIMFMIAAGAGFGSMAAVWLGCRRLFDDRERLRLDRLTGE